jgi:hypothetical protein
MTELGMDAQKVGMLCARSLGVNGLSCVGFPKSCFLASKAVVELA